MKFEKGPGYDWIVTYEDDDGVEEMSVFGQIKIEDALTEARRSFDSPVVRSDADDTVVSIIAIRRVDE